MNNRDGMKTAAMSIASTLISAGALAQEPVKPGIAPVAVSATAEPEKSPCSKHVGDGHYAAFVAGLALDASRDFGGAFLERNNHRCKVAAGQLFYAGDKLRVMGVAWVRVAYFGGRFEMVSGRDISFDPGKVPTEIQKKLNELSPILDSLFPVEPAEKKPVSLVGKSDQQESSGAVPAQRSMIVGMVAATGPSAATGITEPVHQAVSCSIAQIAPSGTYLVDRKRATARIGWDSKALRLEYQDKQGAWQAAQPTSNLVWSGATALEVPYSNNGSTNVRVSIATQPDLKASKIELQPAEVPDSSLFQAPDDKAVHAAWLLWGKGNSQWKVEGFSELTELATTSTFARETLEAARKTARDSNCAALMFDQAAIEAAAKEAPSTTGNPK